MDIYEQLRRDEGDVPHAYQDSLGYWTIGVGHLIDKRKDGGLSQAFRDALLRDDVQRARTDLIAADPGLVSLDPARLAALINMAFQLGVGGVMGFRNLLSALHRHNYGSAAREALDSQWARQTPARAGRIAQQILTGEWQ